MQIAAGPVGGAANLEDTASVLSYARTKRLFAGLDLEGAKVGVAKEKSTEVYGEKITANEILFTKEEIPARFHSFMAALGDLAPIPTN
jgi:lipid-binding SYLF domain-containing protein